MTGQGCTANSDACWAVQPALDKTEISITVLEPNVQPKSGTPQAGNSATSVGRKLGRDIQRRLGEACLKQFSLPSRKRLSTLKTAFTRRELAGDTSARRNF